MNKPSGETSARPEVGMDHLTMLDVSPRLW